MQSFQSKVSLTAQGNSTLLQLGPIDVDVYVEDILLDTLVLNRDNKNFQFDLPVFAFEDGDISMFKFKTALNTSQLNELNSLNTLRGDFGANIFSVESIYFSFYR
jgi:hypothetical protein